MHLDLSNAYDTVWREGLFFKLLANGLNGKFLVIVRSMYDTTKACIKYNNQISDTFACNIGIKQGCSLSCLLFALYLNDLEYDMSLRDCNGITISDNQDGSVMLKMLILLYADDTVILGSSRKDVQYSLQIFAEYCCKWKLKINESKSKIVVFGRDRKNYNFSVNGKPVEKVKTFKYLGVIFSKNGRYIKTIEHNVQQARKAAFAIFRRSREINLSPSCELHILNSIVKPILLYGCEVYCIENISLVETFYLQCLKRILRVKKSTPSYMVYGETGCQPLSIDIAVRSLSFYLKTKNERLNSLPNTLLRSLYQIYDNTRQSSPYLHQIKTSLNNLGCPYLFYQQIPDRTSVAQIKSHLKRVAEDNFLQVWASNMSSSNKAIFYRSFKNTIHFEPYLDILPKALRIKVTKMRLSNHRLPIEIGRWKLIPREQRICPICPVRKLGDEFHFLFECDRFSRERKLYLEPKYYNNPSVYKAGKLFNSTDKDTLIKTAKLINVILRTEIKKPAECH